MMGSVEDFLAYKAQLRASGWFENEDAHSGNSNAGLLFSPCGEFVFRAGKVGYDGWTRFIEWVAGRQDSEYVPKIHGELMQFSSLEVVEEPGVDEEPYDATFVAAVIERLKDWQGHSDSITDAAELALAWNIERVANETCLKMADTMRDMELELGKPNDLHMGNIMRRDGEPSRLVFIDPYGQ
jgi:hypothetical protein